MATKKTKDSTKESTKKKVSAIDTLTNAVYQRHEKDTWSAEFQIGLASRKIEELQRHVSNNPKDYDAQRTLVRLVAVRRKHLKYLKTNKLDTYLAVSQASGLKV